MSASALEIAHFLAKAKNLLSNGQFMFIQRNKNMQSLAKHGLTIADAKNEIHSFVVHDYYDGPLNDNDKSKAGKIWVFKKVIDRTCYYIKLKIDSSSGQEILICLSFHDDERV